MPMDTGNLDGAFKARANAALARGSAFIFLGVGACIAIVTGYWLKWPSAWIGWTALGVASIGFWWNWRLYERVTFLAASHGIRIDDAGSAESGRESSAAPEGRSALILGAKDCVSVAGWGGELPEIDDDARQHIVTCYGEEWVQANEELLQAMLAFVADFRLFAGPEGRELRKFYQGDPRETCLLNIFQCVLRSGALSQPTLQLGKPNLSAFTTSFGLWHDAPEAARTDTLPEPDELEEYSRAGTSVILMAAMSFGMEVYKQGRAA